jgi:c-di-GMP-binding flagellar brake protein YcgR
MVEQTFPSHTANQDTSWNIDRRAWVRLHSEQHAVWIVEKANAAWLGIVRDISSGGMALILRQWLEPGTVLIVELETKAGRPRRALVHVVHSTQDTDDRWITGCGFPSPLSEQELRDFLEE